MCGDVCDQLFKCGAQKQCGECKCTHRTLAEYFEEVDLRAYVFFL